MRANKTIHEELESISKTAAGMPHQLPYGVPSGYFEAFPDKMLALARTSSGIATFGSQEELESISPLLAGLSRKTPFSVPEGYFDQVAGEVQSGISALEETKELLETLSPELESTRYLSTYRVPEHYFLDFPGRMLERVRQDSTAAQVAENSPTSKGKVLQLGSHWLRYAAAAAITGIIALTAWWYQQNQTNDLNDKLPGQLQAQIDQLSDEAIYEYADSIQSAYMGTSTANNSELNEPVFRYLLEDVSDEALQRYLSTNDPANAL